MTAAEVALAAGCTLGEGALWCDRSQRLLFTDIEGRRLHAWHPGSGRAQAWALPDRVGSLALTSGPPSLLLLAMAEAVTLFDLDTGAPVGLPWPVPPEAPQMRLNDGRCDPQGRFVVGTFHPAETPRGHWWRIDGRSGRLQGEQLPLPPVGVANACAFSPDGQRLYFTDSPTRCLWWADYPDQGGPGQPRLLARIADGDGLPDGACVDDQGGLWVALWDGGALLRYHPDGRLDRRIALPARRPTCPAFGGPGLDTLFITSAAIGLAATGTAADAAQGALLALPPAALDGRRGLPTPRFQLG